MGNLSYMSTVDCLKTVSNTGASKCPFDIEQFGAMIAIPTGSYLTASELLTLKTSLEAKIANNTKALRWYPIGTFTNCENKSTEMQIETEGYGGSVVGADGKYHFLFTHNGKMSLHTALKTLHKMHESFDIIFIDFKWQDNGALVGVDRGDGNFYGYPLEMLYVPNYEIGTDKGGKGKIGVQLLNSSDFDTNWAFVALPANMRPNTIKGLEPTKLVQTSATLSSTGVVTLKWMGSTTNLYSRFSGSFDNVIKAYNAVTGQAITVTTVSANAIAETFTIDLDSSDTDWPASAGGEVLFKISVTDLVAESITGIGDCEISIPRA